MESSQLVTEEGLNMYVEAGRTVPKKRMKSKNGRQKTLEYHEDVPEN